MGQIISTEGLRADPNKVKAINEMSLPTDKEGVQRALGMINYVQTFCSQPSKFGQTTESLSRRIVSLSGTKKFMASVYIK